MPAAVVLRKNDCWTGLGVGNTIHSIQTAAIVVCPTNFILISSNQHNDEQPADSDDESIGLLRRR